MTNTETSKSMVDKIRGAGWWQGSVIEDGALRAVEPALPVGFAYWVVASQTCNLYNKDFEKIRKVEWVAAQAVNQSAPSLRGGRHPRLLEVKASYALGDAWLVCDSQERYWGRRENLAVVVPSMAFKNSPALGQSEQHKDNFSAWLARGYTRLELSDELNTVLDEGKFMAAIDKLVAACEADIFGIFIKVWDENGTPTEQVKPPCNIDLRIVVSSEHKLGAVSKKLEDLFAAPTVEVEKGKPKISRGQVLANDFHILLDPQALPAIRWNATLIEEHMRFNFRDFLSGPDADAME